MDSQLIVKYLELRKAHFPESYPGKMYVTGARQCLNAARHQLSTSQTVEAWEAMGGAVMDSYSAGDDWEAGEARVRIVEHADDSSDMDDLKGECYDPDVNPDINRNILKRQEREFESMVERDGVWGYVAQFWDGAEWQDADSIWGFAGQDFQESGYDSDLMQGAMGGLAQCIAKEARAFEATRPDMYELCV